MIGAETLVPWGLALLMLVAPRTRAAVSRLAPAAALPAAAVALLERGHSVELPWLLLGTRLGVDDTAAVFLGLGAVVWTAAGSYARSQLTPERDRARFEIGFLITMGAQLGLATAQDVVTFYLLFWAMTLSSYGLIVHDGSPRARRAGRVYLSMAILGEGLLLPGILLAVDAAGSTELGRVANALATAPGHHTAIVLLLLGFAVKAGLPPLHLWLPLAHPAAPVPASAVLSGVLIKAGLLGWLRFLPLGAVDLPGWGTSLAGLGLATAIAAAAVGVTQREPKTVLAYSSVSQMGWMALIVGLGLRSGPAWSGLLPVLLLFVANHGLAKSSLFLGVGVAHGGALPRPWLVAGLALPALALAGAPLTAGAPAKSALKHAVHALPEPLAALLSAGLSVATFATLLLLARAIALLWPREPAREREATGPGSLGLLAWAGLVIAGLLLPDLASLGPRVSTSGLVPIGLALLASGALQQRGWPLPAIPPGDLLVVLTRLGRPLPPPRRDRRAARPSLRPLEAPLPGPLAAAEARLASAPLLTLLYVTLIGLLALAAGLR